MALKQHTVTCSACGKDFVGTGHCEQRAYEKAMELFSGEEHVCITNWNAMQYDLNNIKREDEDYA
jgi:hypothetical protein